jgi:hypothetical protein
LNSLVLQLAISSDKISGVRKPLLLLKLEVATPDGGKQEQLVELDNAELTNLLKTLRQAQKVRPCSFVKNSLICTYRGFDGFQVVHA